MGTTLLSKRGASCCCSCCCRCGCEFCPRASPSSCSPCSDEDERMDERGTVLPRIWIVNAGARTSSLSPSPSSSITFSGISIVSQNAGFSTCTLPVFIPVLYRLVWRDALELGRSGRQFVNDQVRTRRTPRSLALLKRPPTHTTTTTTTTTSNRATMEVLLIRIDTLRDRKQYLSILKAWLAELKIAHGRLITMGEFHLLFIVAAEAQITQLLEFYATKEIDTNTKDEVCLRCFFNVVCAMDELHANVTLDVEMCSSA